jgi:hypothetical protein
MKMPIRAGLLGLTMLAASASAAFAIDAGASNAPRAYVRERAVRVYSYQPPANAAANPGRRFSYQPMTGTPTYTLRRVYSGTAIDPWLRADFKARAGF